MILKEQQAELEEKHKKYISELKALVRSGDWKHVERKTGLSQTNVHHAFNRVGSVHHFDVVAALEEAIQIRINKYQRFSNK